tara:strand:- start:3281 stop:4384 length:1104 start_codon:yes stop_codon:yes gene_type:complete
MDLSIEARLLSQALHKVIGVVQHKSSQPILTCVLVSASRDGLVSLEATNTNITVSVTVAAKVDGEGSVAIPARKFAEYLGTRQEGSLQLTQSGEGRLAVISNTGRGELPALPALDFPATPKFEGMEFFEIAGSQLHQILGQTIRCASTDESRASLVGVYVHEASDGLRFVATDGHRLAVSRPGDGFEWPLGGEGITLPTRGVEELRKLIDGADKVQMAKAENHLVARTVNQQVCMRLADGGFPDYEGVIPKANDRHATVDRSALLSAVKSVSVFAQTKTSQVEMAFASGALTLAAQSDSGTAREEIEANYDDVELRIGFNFRYLKDALESIHDEKAMFVMGDHLAPALIRPESSEEFICVIMPMRIS